MAKVELFFKTCITDSVGDGGRDRLNRFDQLLLDWFIHLDRRTDLARGFALHLVPLLQALAQVLGSLQGLLDHLAVGQQSVKELLVFAVLLGLANLRHQLNESHEQDVRLENEEINIEMEQVLMVRGMCLARSSD